MLRKFLIVLLSWMIVMQPALSKVGHVEGTRLLAHYFNLAGVDQLLMSVPMQVKSMYHDTVAEQGESAADSQILAALLAAWDHEKIKTALMKNLAIKLEHDKLAKLVSWQNSELANAIKQLDMQTEQDAFVYSFQHFTLKLPHSLPAKEKRVLINEIIDAKQMVNSMVELTLSVSEPVMKALLASPTALSDGFNHDSINQQLDELKALLESDLSQQISLLSYYLYQDISNQDLRAYAAFYQSELGQLELDIFSMVLHQSILLWQEKYR